MLVAKELVERDAALLALLGVGAAVALIRFACAIAYACRLTKARAVIAALAF